MSGKIIIVCRAAHMRGQQVAGPESGALYHVNADDGRLHALEGGQPCSDAGCSSADAEELAQFPMFKVIRSAAAPPPVIEAAAAAEREVVSEPVSELDFSVLDGSISALREALSSGSHDSCLEALIAAEESGKTRKGAMEALNERLTLR